MSVYTEIITCNTFFSNHNSMFSNSRSRFGSDSGIPEVSGSDKIKFGIGSVGSGPDREGSSGSRLYRVPIPISRVATLGVTHNRIRFDKDLKSYVVPYLNRISHYTPPLFPSEQQFPVSLVDIKCTSNRLPTHEDVPCGHILDR